MGPQVVIWLSAMCLELSSCPPDNPADWYNLFSFSLPRYYKWMVSQPFRPQSFQKDNLPRIIMSICDLGQALTLHECHYGRAVLRRRLDVPLRKTQSPLLWACAPSRYQPLNRFKLIFIQRSAPSQRFPTIPRNNTFKGHICAEAGTKPLKQTWNASSACQCIK